MNHISKIIKHKLKFTLLIFLMFFNTLAFSQTNDGIPQKKWFVSAALGAQISGIKAEDFIASNVSPSLMLNTGVWFTNEIGLQLGYKGSYFYTISDDKKHHYSFFFGEVLLNLNELTVGSKQRTSIWSLIIHPGVGYFYNKYYDRPNVCANFGLTNNFNISPRFKAFVDLSAIIGWDIYQGDEDILPSCVFGIVYSFP